MKMLITSFQAAPLLNPFGGELVGNQVKLETVGNQNTTPSAQGGDTNLPALVLLGAMETSPRCGDQRNDTERGQVNGHLQSHCY